MLLDKVPEMKPSIGHSLLRNPVDRYGMFLSSFLRRKPLLDIVSQKHISCDLCTSFACAK
jgi:hypothetical protein